MTGIEGKVVAITGASSGIGRAVATLLAERGAHVVLGARGQERLEAITRDIRDAGGSATCRVTDVTRREDLVGLVETARSEFGRLDVLVSNAGVMPVSPLDDLRVDDWDLMVDVHVKGLLHGIAAALPVFRAQGGGHFVTTASTAGLKIVPTMAVYAGTKFAVRAICEGLRQEAGPDLRVTLVTPGLTATEHTLGMGDDEARARFGATVAELALPADAVAAAMAYAIEQPATVDVNEVVIRPTSQG
ncbi:SDR family oxidoreductase [Nocardioides sp. T2.26MG-1]|uniref:SDR family oxidoreductase n=1 Tax=Nocardioides sp. T2.26MG-1 TaxID=3041166 RepID=UPI00247753A9|nr:SDR family oxidoreductase [Nocardioides sp. T2.26MG-1]CAI9405252.1 putative oxidoreductase [Nocardioides sp. T2.26MG-1]